MKNRLLLLVSAAFVFLSLTEASSGDCDTYFPLDKGTSWTYQEFDKKGKLSSTNTTTVENVISSETKTEFTLKASSLSAKAKKNEAPTENTFSYVCENGILKIDMSTIIPQETQDGFKDMEVTIEQNEILIPSTLVVGQNLADANITMKISSNGMSIMTMVVNTTNRKIVKMEEVTTNAGTYNCAVMTYDIATKMGFAKSNSSAKDWYSSEVGIVKSESYDKNEKLMSSRLLTAYSK